MTLGTITFQANDKMDVFHIAQVVEDGIEVSDETRLNLEDAQFDGDKAWVTGNVPRMKPVNIEGDTAIINAWFKGESFDKPFNVTVYVECEMAEELADVVAEEKGDDGTSADPLEPMEIHLWPSSSFFSTHQ
jgi:hypothetical protein